MRTATARRWAWCTLTALLAGCPATGEVRRTPDAGADGGPGVDAGPAEQDAGPGAEDAGPGAMDAGPPDAGRPPVACERDADCDDLDACNGVETCDPTGGCVAGAPVECPEDGIACTVDECVPADGTCAARPDDALCPEGQSCLPGRGCAACTSHADCDDGWRCNGAETCSSGSCVPGTAVACDDGVACTNDRCMEPSGTCAHVPDDRRCAAGESCLPGVGCAACATDGDCSDGLACNGVETCAGGSCRPGTAVACDDGVACTIDSCAEPTGRCDNAPDDAMCPAGHSCVPGTGCRSCESDADCNDGRVCNGVETCDPALGCRPGTPVACDDGVACTSDRCVEPTGACTSTPDDAMCPSGQTCRPVVGCAACTSAVECDDGLACTGIETCDRDIGCIAGTPVVCDDAIACTVDACTEPAGACTSTPDDTACGPGEVCTAGLGCEVPVCMAAGCASGGGDGNTCGAAFIVGRTAATTTASYAGDTYRDGNDDDLSTSASECWDAKYDNFYRIYLRAGDRIDVTLDVMAPAFNAMMKLYTGVDCDGGPDGADDLLFCRNGASDGGDESFTHTAATEGWYTIVVDGRLAFTEDADWGAYGLSVTLTCAGGDCCCD